MCFTHVFEAQRDQVAFKNHYRSVDNNLEAHGIAEVYDYFLLLSKFLLIYLVPAIPAVFLLM